MFRALTVAREFGSGGAAIASIAAGRLGWRLIDSALIMSIAEAAKVDPELARRYDERVDSWLHRMSRRGLSHGTFESVAGIVEDSIFDAETVKALANTLIREAYKQGNCVIVGRGGQCILQDRPDVFHVYVYAPLRDRVRRVRSRIPAAEDAEKLIRDTESMRDEYVRMHYGCERANPHLYHLMINSVVGDETAASAIMCAMEGGLKLHG